MNQIFPESTMFLSITHKRYTVDLIRDLKDHFSILEMIM